ncbi:hypothetical protein A9Q84_17710 [Halobacteriovorax marinus]|uniref:Response regulatory domain-containing protein n=1 Tax=Halobacteriovorax marinus TaxID=97084 RepID=A0A1Y5F371_9BACT|nr:hypothetical protein A9Q84_17710 [Halobacteriovorax marinus]
MLDKEWPMMEQGIDLVIVDDDPIIGKILLGMLSEFDLTVHFYDDSIEALPKILADRPKLVVLDYNMPGLDGHQLIIKFSESLIFQSTSVFLLTAEVLNESDKIKLMTLGFEKIIPKPIDREHFLALLEGHFGELKIKAA